MHGIKVMESGLLRGKGTDAMPTDQILFVIGQCPDQWAFGLLLLLMIMMKDDTPLQVIVSLALLVGGNRNDCQFRSARQKDWRSNVETAQPACFARQ